MLAIAGCVWTISHAICMATGESGHSMLAIYSGTLQGASLPCESASEEEPCVPCATVALSAENGLYYLTGLSEEWQNFCDREFLTPHNAMNMSYSYHALLSGTRFERGESQFIQVNYMQVNKIELWRSENWLLGGWKVEKETVCDGDGFGGVFTRTIADEILYMFYDQWVVHTVNGATYDNLLTYSTQNQSNGTMLLTVKGLFDTVEREHPWDGGNSPITIYKLTDKEMEWQFDSYGGDEGPVTFYQYLKRYSAAKQQIDTIQLYKYVKDSPGSSTVDPVDPNQVVATLQGEYLTIHEYTGDEIGYTLQKSPSSAPARRNTQAQTKIAADTFRGSASIQVSEYGTYTLELTNPLWDYTLVGTFYYGANGLEPVTPEMPAYKYLIDGRMFIRQGDRIYTPTGMQVE